MKKFFAILTAGILSFSMVACGSSNSAPPSQSQNESTPTETPKKIGLLLSTGGLGDKNFNDMAYDGLLKAQEEFGVEFDYVEPKSVSDFVPNYRMFAESEEYDVILGIGSDQSEAIMEVAADFPDQKFSIIDSNAEGENISAIYTKWQEQTFLTGVLAGLGTLSDMDKANPENVVGVILGKEAPALVYGVTGFIAGAKYVNPDIEVLEAVVGEFNDPGKGKEIALSMYSRGADFVQHIAGASGLGVFNAAKESNRYAFGVGGNQNANEPDYIVATALRNVNQMVFNEVKTLVDGSWIAGVHISGIKEGAVGFDAFGSNVALPDNIQASLDEIKAKIISGELIPCSERTELDAWLQANSYQ